MSRRRKRIIKPPSQAVVLSIMACILIVGAPALVSMIDESYTEEYTYEGVFFDDEVKVSPYGNTETVTLTVISDENNLKVSVDQHTLADTISQLIVKNIDPNVFANMGELVIYTDVQLTNDWTRVKMTNGGIVTSALLITETITNEDNELVGYKYVPTVHQLIKLKNADYIEMSIQIPEESRSMFYDFDFIPYYSDVINYGEIIIGFTGAVLILCALFATPYFGLGGITAKSRRR